MSSLVEVMGRVLGERTPRGRRGCRFDFLRIPIAAAED